MSLSPSDILQRLKQLKVWQENQEELLKKTKNLMDTNASASDYQTIEGLSAFDSTSENSPIKPKNWEAQVISPTKSFNELLEEKLSQDPGPGSVVLREKKPFLRKGAGLERFRMRTRPPPKTVRTKKRNKSEGATPLRAPDLAIKTKATWSRVEDSGGEHVRKINEIVQTNKASDQTLYEKQLEKELLIFEALEQRADNSSFCSTNSSVVRLFGSTPTKKQPTIPEEKRVHWESNSEDEDVIETNLEKEDIAEILLRLKSLAGKKPEPPSIIEADEEEWTTSPSSDDSSVTSADLEETLKVEKRDVGIATEACSAEMCAICGEKLARTITEYERRIKEIIQDKNRMVELKEQLEQKEREFLKRKREFEDEKQELLFEVETEKKKLSKEKHVFQMNMKDAQNRPNKKERQEISHLKQEVADLTETLKLKESKNGMTQARLRNQIKQLEKENSNLKDEVEKLTKENAKLAATHKLNRKSGDSKILHEINKNVSKLTQESKKSGKKVEEEPKTWKRKDENEAPSRLDTEDSFLEMGAQDLEAQYESTFRSQSSRTSDKVERVRDDGTKEIKYTNGNVKIVSPDGNSITIQYFNGDQQETSLLDGTVRYYFSSKNIRQTTFADGLEVVEFPEGVVEKRHTDGRCEVTLSDGVVQTTFPDGSQETIYTDGSVVKITTGGEKILLLTNGQKEIETKEYKRREYPDGTVKILYPDGTQETKYANGRVRIKDRTGTLVLDTQS